MNHLVKITLFIFTLLSSKDSSDVKYFHSSIMKIPNLSFLERTYSGLDILEQMDFSPLKDKKIAILTNHTAVNRNGDHILDLIHHAANSEISFILEFENGLWGVDDKRSKLKKKFKKYL